MAHSYGRTWHQTRAIVLATRPAICAYCGQPIDLTLPGTHPDGPTVDHLIPVSRGGTDTPSNLAPMHQRCNAAKRNDPLPRRNSRDW